MGFAFIDVGHAGNCYLGWGSGFTTNTKKAYGNR